MIPVIHSERLTFRSWREGDFDAFASVYTDAEQSRFIGGPMSRDDAWRRMASFVGHWSLRGFGIWALEDKTTGAFVGWSGLWFPEGFPEREIGWTLVPAFRGRGLAQEAGARVRAFAYDTLGWPTVTSLINFDNVASVRVAEKLGAAVERAVHFRGADSWIYRHPANAKAAA